MYEGSLAILCALMLHEHARSFRYPHVYIVLSPAVHLPGRALWGMPALDHVTKHKHDKCEQGWKRLQQHCWTRVEGHLRSKSDPMLAVSDAMQRAATTPQACMREAAEWTSCSLDARLHRKCVRDGRPGTLEIPSRQQRWTPPRGVRLPRAQACNRGKVPWLLIHGLPL